MAKRKTRATSKQLRKEQPTEGYKQELRTEAEAVYSRYTRNVERLSELIQKTAGLGFTLGTIMLTFSKSSGASDVVAVFLVFTILACVASGLLAAVSIHRAQARDDAMWSVLFPAVLCETATEDILTAAALSADEKRKMFDKDVEKYNRWASVVGVSGIALFLISVLLAAVC
ncbi:MAG: hypothetical protein H6841_08445 [Planctomycetes bacterium]|nr:hypothetical protein [Planctomycetota bacterium]